MNIFSKRFSFNLLKINGRCYDYIVRRKTIRNGTLAIAASSATALTMKPLVLDDKYSTYTFHFWAGIRFLRSLKVGVLISLDYYFSTMGLNESLCNYKFMMGRIHKRAATRILEGCLENGGTYIKLGQGLVSLSHILPAEYIDTLTQLQDKCLLKGPREMYQMILEDLGKSHEELFSFIDEEPIAAASLAQVFRGITYDGKVVAIKVQYRDLQSRFLGDVATIDFLLKFIGFIHPDFNFDWVLKDLSSRLKYELDFINEGKNAEKCAIDLQSFSYIYVPKIRWDLTSSRILVTEFINGVKINNNEEIAKLGVSLKEIDTKLIEAFGHQIFQSGFVHADPHPGNLLVRKVKNKLQIVLLDHGLYENLQESTRNALSCMWKAIVLQNFEAMKKYSTELNVKDPEVFAEILTQRPVKSTGFVLTTKITQEEMDYMTKQAQHKFDKIMAVLQDMPRSILLVVRNLNTIRSIVHNHGDPVDRYTILARCATVQSFQHRGLLCTFRNISVKVWFEIKLFTGRFWIFYVKRLLKCLEAFGRSPNLVKFIDELH